MRENKVAATRGRVASREHPVAKAGGHLALRRRAETFVPRFIRRHYTEVMAVAFTSRIHKAGRRERKVRAKIMRLDAKYGLVR